jgi:hypothetical protein
MSGPKIALIATTYFFGSHADVIGTRLIEGYEWHGQPTPARVEVASLYLEQDDNAGRPDVGVRIARTNGVPRFPTVAEAIGCGRGGVQVDGVVIVGEHGEYEHNEYGQKLYPRRRLFDTAVGTMIAAGKTVPVFVDKHLSWGFGDAKAMVDTADRLGIPMLAGSTIPLTWRIPTGTQWPLGAPMTDAVAVGYGGIEGYGFHTLEGLQAQTERRRGAESGVSAVQCLTGDPARKSLTDGTVDAKLLQHALDALDLNADQQARAARSTNAVFLIEYADGLRAAAVMFGDVVGNWAAACRGPEHEMACQMFLPGAVPGAPSEHFTLLVRQIESMVLGRVAPYPVQRTLLTTGMLDALMRSRHEAGNRRRTPELAVRYTPAAEFPDTGLLLPYPQPVRAAP